jgi:Putative zinc-finger
MSCDEFRDSLSLFIDGGLGSESSLACQEHMNCCPVCRAEILQLRRITRAISALPRPVAPAELADTISASIAIEASAVRARPRQSLLFRAESWIEPRLMPYTIGALASLLLFVGMLTALRPHLRALHDAEMASKSFLSGVSGWAPDITQPVSPEGWAKDRAPFGVESPSLNPRGALAALTLSPSHGHPGDDDMVVITDVFTDGRAAVADVVQAPRDKRMLSEFQDALRLNAAFVPAAYDRRPQTMRVVFVFQRVEVKEQDF